MYIKTFSNHSPQVIQQLPTSIEEELSNNLLRKKNFDISKYEYVTALRNSGYKLTELIFNRKEHRKQKRNHSRNKIYFNLPFSSNVTTNVAKRFLNLLDIKFPKSNKFHKIFNRNTVIVSYCCTGNLLSITKTSNKDVIYEKKTPKYQCNCRNRNDCPLDGNCGTSDIIYKFIASTTVNPGKI